MTEQLCVATVVSLPFGQNTYIANLDGRNDCLVVDPGLEPGKILKYLDGHRLVPAALLITHGHGDHIGGVAALKMRWPDCPIVVGSGDAAKLTDPELNLSESFGVPLVCPAADVMVNDGNVYQAAGLDLHVLEIPGHSAGHVAYLWEGQDPPVVWVGDIIFAGSVGRADFPDGDFRQLLAGIRSKLLVLPDATILLSGHGPATTVGEEKRSNPYVGQRSRPAF